MTPSGSAASIIRVTACLVSGVISCCGRSNTTVAVAVDPSAEIARTPSAMVSRSRPTRSCCSDFSSTARCLSSSACCLSSWARVAFSRGLDPVCSMAASVCLRALSSCLWPLASRTRPSSTWARPPVTFAAWTARVSSAVNGSATWSTPSRSATFRSAALTPARCPSVSRAPFAAQMTTCPVPPLATGSSVFSRSVTCSVGVPGMVIVELMVPPNATKAPTARPSTTTQAVITHQARRAVNRPSR